VHPKLFPKLNAHAGVDRMEATGKGLLQEHKAQMAGLGLETQRGLVFVTPKTYGHLYDSGLERVWKRSQRRVGIEPRRLYAQRHSFLSHALAMGNSPADLAAVAGHRTEELLKTYAKPTGRMVMPTWQTA